MRFYLYSVLFFFFIKLAPIKLRKNELHLVCAIKNRFHSEVNAYVRVPRITCLCQNETCFYRIPINRSVTYTNIDHVHTAANTRAIIHRECCCFYFCRFCLLVLLLLLLLLLSYSCTYGYYYTKQKTKALRSDHVI